VSVLRECGILDFSKLCIAPGEKVWTVFIDIYPINADGNLIDAATIGAVAALRKAVLPELNELGKPDYSKEFKKPLPLNTDTLPLSFSFFKLGNSIFLDPTREEEEASDVRVTFGISKWNGQYMLNSCQKYGEKTISGEEVEKIMSIISEKYDELIKKLKNFL
jgi:exosome complex component RRP42